MSAALDAAACPVQNALSSAAKMREGAAAGASLSPLFRKREKREKNLTNMKDSVIL